MVLSNTKICILYPSCFFTPTSYFHLPLFWHFTIEMLEASYFEINKFNLAQRVLKDSFFIRVDGIVQIQDNLYCLVEYNCTLSTWLRCLILALMKC